MYMYAGQIGKVNKQQSTTRNKLADFKKKIATSN